MATDFINTAITRILQPTLKDAGFRRTQKKSFVRLRGELVDVLTFQMSRWGGKAFYVHYFTNPLCDPEGRLADSYVVGSREGSNVQDDVIWHGPDEASANAAIQSVLALSKAVLLPWYSEIVDLDAYSRKFLKVPSRRRKSAHYLSVAASLERIDECLALYKEMQDRNEAIGPEVVALAQAIAEDKVSELLGAWRTRNLQRLKLA